MSSPEPGKHLQRALESLHAQREGNPVSVNSAEISAYGCRDTQPRSAPEEHLPPIHHIPHEILLHIIHIYVQDSDCPIRDLSGVALVCHRWRAIVEDSSSLWGRIDASEGLAAVRKGLRMAKDAALYITYNKWRSRTDQSAFFEAIGGRIGRWRSLIVDTDEWKHCPAILETTVPPRLEKLHLSTDPSLWGRTLDDPLIFFGGAVAPPGLKDVHLEDIPIAVTPLKLACLTSLHLEDIHNLSMSELLRILSDSPALEILTLACIEDLVPDTALNIPSGWTIQLLSLSRLSLIYLSDTFIHFFLSALAAPHLQRLHVDCCMEGIPSSQLLNENLVRLAPTLTSLISTASEIKVTITGESRYKILAGGLAIEVGLVDDALLHFQDSFEWLSNHSGGRLRILPTHLRIENCDSNSNIAYLEWFTSRAVVTKLTLSSNSILDQDPGRIIYLLSNPIPSSPTSWYLPYLEVLDAHLDSRGGSFGIVQMIERRHTTNREKGEGGLGVPKKFTEIRLSRGMFLTPIPLSPNVELLKSVVTAGEGAEVFWGDKKWTGTPGLEE